MKKKTFSASLGGSGVKRDEFCSLTGIETKKQPLPFSLSRVARERTAREERPIRRIMPSPGRGGGNGSSRPRIKHRPKSPTDQVHVDREDILSLGTKGGNNINNTNGSNNKINESSPHANNNGKVREGEISDVADVDYENMDRKEYFRSYANENINGVGCSPLTLILLTLGFDVTIEFARKALAENPEDVKWLFFFYERILESIASFFGLKREDNGNANTSFSSGLSLVCDSSAPSSFLARVFSSG